MPEEFRSGGKKRQKIICDRKREVGGGGQLRK